MKRIRSLLLFLIFCFSWMGSQTLSAQEQVFTITDMKGVVLINGTDTLKTGMKIREDAEISFGNDQSVLELLNPGDGTFFVVLPVSRPGQKKEEAFSLRKHLLAVNFAMTRGSNKIKTLEAFESYYSRSNFLIFEKSVKAIQISGLQIDENNLLFVQYMCAGKAVNIRLQVSGDSLLIDEEIFLLNGVFIQAESPVKIGYYQSEEQQTNILVEDFKPVFIKYSAFEEDIIQKAELVRSMANADAVLVLEALESYVSGKYGFVEKEDLAGWYTKRYTN